MRAVAWLTRMTGPAVARQPFGGSDLVLPGESALGIRGELDIVGRVGVDEISALDGNVLDVSAREHPVGEHVPIFGKIVLVADALVAAEWDVELAGLIEAAQAVEAGPIEVVKKRGRFGGVLLAARDELVEPGAVPVEQPLVVLHRQVGLEAPLQPAVEVDQMRIRVVEQRALRGQTEGDGEATGERFDEPPVRMRLPERAEMRHLPALAAGPFQRGPEDRMALRRGALPLVYLMA